MVKHETPDWLDEVWEREEVSPEEYFESFGLTKEQYWMQTWQLAEEREQWTKPATRSLVHTLFKWLFG